MHCSILACDYQQHIITYVEDAIRRGHNSDFLNAIRSPLSTHEKSTEVNKVWIEKHVTKIEVSNHSQFEFMAIGKEEHEATKLTHGDVIDNLFDNEIDMVDGKIYLDDHNTSSSVLNDSHYDNS